MSLSREDDPQETLERAKNFLLSSENELIEEDRFRDFIVSRSFEDDNQTVYDFGEVDLPPETHDILNELVAERLLRHSNKLEDESEVLKRYGVGLDDRDYIEYLSGDDFAFFNDYHDIFETTNLQDTTYDEDPKPDFQAIRIMNAEGDVLLGIQYYWNHQLLGNNSLFNIRYLDGEYVPIQDPIIAIPNRLDAIFFDGTLFVLNEWQFEQMFNYREEYEAIAEDVLDTLEQGSIKFEDFDLVRSAVLSNIHLLRKVRDIDEGDRYGEITMDHAIEIIDNFDLDGVDYQPDENGEYEITIENKRKVWDLIRMFNDDHLISPILNIAYQTSGSKVEKGDAP